MVNCAYGTSRRAKNCTLIVTGDVMQRMFYRLVRLASIMCAVILSVGSGTMIAQSADDVCVTSGYYSGPDPTFSPDSKYIVSTFGAKKDTAQLWNIETGTIVQTFTNEFDDFRQFAFSSDGKYLLTGWVNMTLWEVKTGRKLYEFGADGGLYGDQNLG